MLNPDDFIAACNKQLEATYTGPDDGTPCPYYQVLNHQLANASDPVKERFEAGFIHPDNAKYMIRDQES